MAYVWPRFKEKQRESGLRSYQASRAEMRLPRDARVDVLSNYTTLDGAPILARGYGGPKGNIMAYVKRGERVISRIDWPAHRIAVGDIVILRRGSTRDSFYPDFIERLT